MTAVSVDREQPATSPRAMWVAQVDVMTAGAGGEQHDADGEVGTSAHSEAKARPTSGSAMTCINAPRVKRARLPLDAPEVGGHEAEAHGEHDDAERARGSTT
ncbi:MAG: hypothetical protein R3F65_31025 [bacterium]